MWFRGAAGAYDYTPRQEVIPFEDKLRFTMNRQVKTQDCLEERMQNVNKVWWRDLRIYRSKDVPWRVKCRRLVEHVHSVFCFGSEKLVMGVM